MSQEDHHFASEPFLECYERHKLMKGGQGTVWKYAHPLTGKEYAVKVVWYDLSAKDETGNANNTKYIKQEMPASVMFDHVCADFFSRALSIKILTPGRNIYFERTKSCHTKKVSLS